jgi:phenylpropionate dioxygenase-like ring-hydroxylating dioxygenase large terminal subunit
VGRLTKPASRNATRQCGTAAIPGQRPASSNRYGAPRAAWYPVGQSLALRGGRVLRARLHGEDVDVREEGGRISVFRSGGSPDWAATAHLGLIWLCAEPGLSPVPDLFDAGEFGADHWISSACLIVRADYDQAVLGLVDPAHVPMIHDAWWWRSPKARRVKTKMYDPSPYGFTARAADAFASAKAYNLVGQEREISIEFRLPSIRVERIASGPRRVLNMTSVTPLDADTVALRNVTYSNIGALKWLAAPGSAWSRAFLRQDARILEQLEPVDQASRSPLFAGDPDQPSLWYFACKRALHQAQTRGKTYAPPFGPAVLTWLT